MRTWVSFACLVGCGHQDGAADTAVAEEDLPWEERAVDADAVVMGGGYGLSALGDSDGDGYGELLTMGPRDEGGTPFGGLAAFDGPLSGQHDVDSAQAHVYSGSSSRVLGDHLSGGADADGDGLADVWAYAGGVNDDPHIAYLLAGPWASDRTTDAAEAVMSSSDIYRGRPQQTGDLGGDGLADLLWVTTDGVSVVLGPFSGTSQLDERHLEVGFWTDIQGTVRAEGRADLTGDGLADLALWSLYSDGPMGLVIFEGPLSEELVADDALVHAEASTEWTTGTHFRAADLDGDGTQDLVTSDYFEERLSVFMGPVTSVPAFEATPAFTLEESGVDELEVVRDPTGSGHDLLVVSTHTDTTTSAEARGRVHQIDGTQLAGGGLDSEEIFRGGLCQWAGAQLGVVDGLLAPGELALAITAPGCDQYGEKYSSNPDWPGLTYVIAPW